MMVDALPVAIGICSRGTLAKRARSVVVRIEANPKPYVGYIRSSCQRKTLGVYAELDGSRTLGISVI